MKVVLSSICFAALAVGCTSHNAGAPEQASSGLTSIDVTLPAKDKLPAGLDVSNLYYCFSITNSVPVYESGKPDCIMPMYSEAQFRSGKYESQLKLDGKLKSNESYAVSLLIGHKSTGQSSGGVVAEGSEAAEGGPYAPSRMEAETADSSVIVIDSFKLFYQGHKMIYPSDMNGKSSINVTIELQGYGNMEETTPEQISTEGTDVDVKVEAVFKEQGNPITSGPT